MLFLYCVSCLVNKIILYIIIMSTNRTSSKHHNVGPIGWHSGTMAIHADCNVQNAQCRFKLKSFFILVKLKLSFSHFYIFHFCIEFHAELAYTVYAFAYTACCLCCCPINYWTTIAGCGYSLSGRRCRDVSYLSGFPGMNAVSPEMVLSARPYASTHFHWSYIHVPSWLPRALFAPSQKPTEPSSIVVDAVDSVPA